MFDGAQPSKSHCTRKQSGVDYAFFNETHYPFDNLQFRLYPEGASFDINSLYSVVPDPIIDGCE